MAEPKPIRQPVVRKLSVAESIALATVNSQVLASQQRVKDLIVDMGLDPEKTYTLRGNELIEVEA